MINKARGLLLTCCLLLGASALAQENAPAPPSPAPPPPPLVLVMPVQPGAGVDLPEATEMASLALKRAIEKQPPWKATIFDAQSPVFLRGVEDKTITAQDLVKPVTVAVLIKLAKVASATAVTTADLSKRGNLLVLRVLFRSAKGTAIKVLETTSDGGRPPRISREIIQGMLEGMADAAVVESSSALRLLAEGKEPTLTDQAREHLDQGRKFLAGGKYDEALAEYDRALALEPTCLDCCLEAADAHAAKSNWDAAIMLLRRALSIDPESLPAHLKLAEAYSATDRAPLAIEQYRFVLARQPGLVAAREKLAEALLQTGERDEAITQYQRVAAAAPNELAAHQKLAEAYLKTRRYDDAIKELSIVVKLQPNDQTSALNLGWLLLQQERLPEGIAALRAAHDRAGKPYSYDADRYRELVGYLDREASTVYAAAYQATPQFEARRLSAQEFLALATDWHTRSDNLAHLLERTAPAADSMAGYNQRVFCYRLLNQSDYELIQYAQNGDRSHLERASLQRDACRTALTRALELDQQKPIPAPTSTTTPAAPPS